MYISTPTYDLVLFRGITLPSPENAKLYSKPRHPEVCRTTDPQSLSNQVH